jgi:hypothetical protein
MELLGMNLSELRRRLPATRHSFSPATTVRLVVQMIQCVAATTFPQYVFVTL